MTKTEIFNTEFAPLMSYLKTRARSSMNEQDAEDLVQNTLMKIWEVMDAYTPGTNAKGFAITIQRQLAIDSHRKRKLSTVELGEWNSGTSESPEDLYVRQESLDEVHQAIDDLDEPLKEVFSLIGVQGIKYREAAVTLDLPSGTTFSRQFRARQKLKAALVG